ncbi:hypothetical protein HPB50_011311 [Hyalomma asiaticum]|uniref:Uncharacterized protein n=1 Tax=Hyalomma asiaticum TaxID=266040 RepID=A0ACB7RWM4_HYAAI|nr:hypothetical protein HPB50_011311 [Hyalomma asiaticum]
MSSMSLIVDAGYVVIGGESVQVVPLGSGEVIRVATGSLDDPEDANSAPSPNFQVNTAASVHAVAPASGRQRHKKHMKTREDSSVDMTDRLVIKDMDPSLPAAQPLLGVDTSSEDSFSLGHYSVGESSVEIGTL